MTAYAGYVERVLVLSFYHTPAHIRDEDPRELKNCGWLDYAYLNFGMFFDLAGLMRSDGLVEKMDMPEWFRRIARLARKEGCSFVMFDYDEEEHPDLPVYED